MNSKPGYLFPIRHTGAYALRAFAIVTLAACRGADAKPAALTAQREETRAILLQHCGECHDPARKSALPAALAIFDATATNWSAHMTPAQLRNALWRLGEPIPPEGRPNDVSDDERARFGRYVEAEIAARSASTK